MYGFRRSFKNFREKNKTMIKKKDPAIIETEEEEIVEEEDEKPWYEHLVIDSENKYKGFHDINMIFIICYSCITAFYYFGFESPSNMYWIYWDNFVDVYFYLDFIL